MTAQPSPSAQPPSTPAQPATRPAGQPHYFAPEQQIFWRYKRRDSNRTPAGPETIRPMTVVHDDADALVAWLAPSTPIVRPVLADGRGVREVPLAERDRTPRARQRDAWQGTGILKIAPTAAPWSVWVFWHEDWTHRFWYVNLERVHVRDADGILTEDHVLDVVVAPDGSSEWKDEDELAAAVQAGRFTAAEAAAFEADARAVEKIVASWDAPFNQRWQDWRPVSNWSLPSLPADLATDYWMHR